MHNSYKPHLEAIYGIICYKEHLVWKLCLREIPLKAYTDADWVGSVVDRRFTTGYFIFVA